MRTRIKGHPTELFIIQVNAATSESSDEEMEKICEEVNITLSKRQEYRSETRYERLERKIDLKSKCKACGMFGLGERNDCVGDVTNWCEKNSLIITNTCFKNRNSRFYTWKSQEIGHGTELIKPA